MKDWKTLFSSTFLPAASNIAASPQAVPIAMVCTGGLTY